MPLIWWVIAGAAVVLVLGAAAFMMGIIPGAPPTPSPTASGSPEATLDTSQPRTPEATPLANPPAAPAGDGTTAQISFPSGVVTIELFTESSPVAAENFINLAEVGYYDGVFVHRIVPGFVIQMGDPTCNVLIDPSECTFGGGGPSYGILDEPVVGEYERGIVAMARSPQPNSQGSQFFIVLDDSVRQRLDKAGGYAIFGRVTEGMDIVDEIALIPRVPGSDAPEVYYQMDRVTIQRP